MYSYFTNRIGSEHYHVMLGNVQAQPIYRDSSVLVQKKRLDVPTGFDDAWWVWKLVCWWRRMIIIATHSPCFDDLREKKIL